MKELEFHYQLRLIMDTPVTGQRFTLRCTPQSDERQQITQYNCCVTPSDFISTSRDQWGNILTYGCRKELHSCLETDISGVARTGLADSTAGSTPMRDDLFRYATALTRTDEALAEFADSISLAGSSRDQAEAVMQAVHSCLEYTPGRTNFATTAAEAFALGLGVCQDYSHIMLAVLRRRGIPARYAAGMLLGEGKSHAWVEVLMGGRWYAYDPTNCAAVTDQHIKLSHGRDAGDCTINRGVFLGSSGHRAQVSVTVRERKP